MNEGVARVLRAASCQLPPRPESYFFDTAADEVDVKDLLARYGTDWKVTSDWNDYEKWDIEGTMFDGIAAKVEVKSRRADTAQYDTWIIDAYKVTNMLNMFPEDHNFFVNVANGKAHLYDMNFIAQCDKRDNVRSFTSNGRIEYKSFYYIPKDQFILNLTTGEEGAGAFNYAEIIKEKNG